MGMNERLAQQQFDSLETMMTAYAQEAVRRAAESHGMVLDFSPESVERLDTVLAAEKPTSGRDLEWATKLWGGYFGEVFRQHHPANWIMTVYPGSDFAMPALEVHGSQLYPLLKVQRRLTMGPGEDLSSFYRKVSSALQAQTKAH
jgi:hypothetical protein